MTTVEAGGREASVRLPAVGSPTAAREVAASVGQDDPLLEGLAGDLLASRRAVPLHQILEQMTAGPGLDRVTLEALCRELRSQGYAVRALDVAGRIAERWPTPGTRGRVTHLEGEIAALEGRHRPPTRSTTEVKEPLTGSVLMVMGRSLPDVDTPYTRHVHDTARALQQVGLRVEVATELGFRAVPDAYRTEEVDGVVYHRLPGPLRGETPLDGWLQRFSHKLSAVVRKTRPATVVAHSDFLNAVPAIECAAAVGVPVVYDISGDWDASWYRRQQEALGWPDAEQLAISSQGLPDRYTHRRARERATWSEVAHVVLTSRHRALAAEVAATVNGGTDGYTVLGDDPLERYLDVLDTVGALPRGLRALSGAVPGPTDRRALVVRAGSERRQLERHVTLDLPASVPVTMTTGWVWNGLAPVQLGLPVDWRGACAGNRSQNFRLHAWSFMSAVLLEHQRHGNTALLDWCHDRALSWCASVLDDVEPLPMAWYDMALALRAPVLAFLFEAAVADPRRSTADLDLLHRAVIEHQRALLAPTSFNVATNHGLYTAIGQIAFARRLGEMPGMGEVAALGRERLAAVAAGQFAADGGHREHSPDYHRMLVDSFVDAVEDELVDDPNLIALIERAANVTGWFIRPDGTIEQIGDSPARLVSPGSRSSRDPETRFVLTRGRRGEAPSRETLLLPEAGYAVIRAPRPTSVNELAAASHLTLAGAFHSRTHKHADDLALTWYDGGTEILIDSGRFGYLDLLPDGHPDRDLGFFYSRPERQYVESTPAHSTVSADGRDHDRRERRPYGSAVRSAGRDGDAYVVVGEVDHVSWWHRREARLIPGRRLEVRDEVKALDGAEHAFTTWWNLADAFREDGRDGRSIVFAGSGVRVRVEEQDGAGTWSVARGVEEPLRGWRSRHDFELTPCLNLSRTVTAAAHVFVTTFDLEVTA